MIIERKICRVCGIEKDINKNNFHYDTRKEMLGHNPYRAMCKICTNKRKLPKSRERYALVGKAESKVQYWKHREKKLEYAKLPEVVERRKKVVSDRRKRNPEKFDTWRKKWIENNKERWRNIISEHDKKRIESLTDTYIVQLVSRFFKIPRNEVKENKDLIEMYRNHVKLKRLCQQ